MRTRLEGQNVVLPNFKYHPDPIFTRSIRAGSSVCDCCGQARGFEYTASFYSAHDPKPTLCPWCIASGDAASKYEGQFSDDYPLHQAGIAEDIILEVCERTPGYASWQQEIWQSHCADACEFHGDADPLELRALTDAALANLLRANGMTTADWASFVRTYQVGGNPAVYKFVCRRCREAIYSLDFT
jgi:uncharacterized protein CbrC (UPF0167 family)